MSCHNCHNFVNIIISIMVLQHLICGGSDQHQETNVINRLPLLEKSTDIHVVFVTDCSEYLEWQSLLLFHSAKMVGHRGKVTRIVCGCNRKRKAFLKENYRKLYPNYKLRFQPDFSKNQSQTTKCELYYKYSNFFI